MIALRRALVRAVRRGRLVLVPLLAVLITAHLASAAHSAPFAATSFGGPGAGIVALCPPQHHAADGSQPAAQAARDAKAAQGAQGTRDVKAAQTAQAVRAARAGQAVHPLHGHDCGAHLDHSVDRPRDPGEHPLVPPGLPGLPGAVTPAEASAAGGCEAAAAQERDGPPVPADGRSLFGVWRL
ncbi:hypothetical protein [Streptomyces sp. KLOTTS4A1]|uniref:hypothetical protein n=1 Tax=Streptomyces sp. KLOTTS4A1 TaxID=3390996 RepID=UPI0039F58D3F